MDASEEKEISCPYREPNPQPVQSVASRYAHYTTPGPWREDASLETWCNIKIKLKEVVCGRDSFDLGWGKMAGCLEGGNAPTQPARET
jgi:hypothetical protein